MRKKNIEVIKEKIELFEQIFRDKECNIDIKDLTTEGIGELLGIDKHRNGVRDIKYLCIQKIALGKSFVLTSNVKESIKINKNKILKLKEFKFIDDPFINKLKENKFYGIELTEFNKLHINKLVKEKQYSNTAQYLMNVCKGNLGEKIVEFISKYKRISSTAEYGKDFFCEKTGRFIDVKTHIGDKFVIDKNYLDNFNNKSGKTKYFTYIILIPVSAQEKYCDKLMYIRANTQDFKDTNSNADYRNSYNNYFYRTYHELKKIRCNTLKQTINPISSYHEEIDVNKNFKIETIERDAKVNKEVIDMRETLRKLMELKKYGYELEKEIIRQNEALKNSLICNIRNNNSVLMNGIKIFLKESNIHLKESVRY